MNQEISQIRSKGIKFPDFSNFPSLNEVRDVANAGGLEKYMLVSLSTRFRISNQNVEYFGHNGWGTLSENDVSHFFQQTNLARFAARTIPQNEYWYAMIAGHFPDRLINDLERHKTSFDALKIGAARPIRLNEDRYIPILEFAQQSNWPVLVHCSGESDSQDFFDICSQIKGIKNYYILSHMGGMKQKGIGHRHTNFSNILERAEFLDKNRFENVYLNTAIYELDILNEVFSKYPAILDRIVISMDLPFFGSFFDTRKNYLNLRPDYLAIMEENSRRFFSCLNR